EKIIGLDNFKKCDDVELVCTPDASDAEPGDAGDAGDASDALVLSDSLSEASSWPQWRMDNTQVEVTGGAADASLQNFKPDSGLIVDGVTNGKLQWIPKLGVAGSIDDAAAFCATVTGRLPTRIEMATLLDSTRGKPPFIAPAFDKVLSPDGGPLPSGFLWTS